MLETSYAYLVDKVKNQRKAIKGLEKALRRATGQFRNIEEACEAQKMCEYHNWLELKIEIEELRRKNTRLKEAYKELDERYDALRLAAKIKEVLEDQCD